MRCLRYSSSSVILLEYQASKMFIPEGCCLQDASGRCGLRIGLGKIKTCAAAKLLLARSAATGPNHQTAATEDFKSRSEERRVGKECRYRACAGHQRKQATETESSGFSEGKTMCGLNSYLTYEEFTLDCNLLRNS